MSMDREEKRKLVYEITKDIISHSSVSSEYLKDGF
jgi:hypothetical protein